MNEYSAKLTLEANSQEEFVEKLEAFNGLSTELNHEELLAVADFVINYPNTIKLIKDELPTLKNASTLELIGKAGGLITKIKTALDKDGYES